MVEMRYFRVDVVVEFDVDRFKRFYLIQFQKLLVQICERITIL